MKYLKIGALVFIVMSQSIMLQAFQRRVGATGVAAGRGYFARTGTAGLGRSLQGTTAIQSTKSTICPVGTRSQLLLSPKTWRSIRSRSSETSPIESSEQRLAENLKQLDNESTVRRKKLKKLIARSEKNPNSITENERLKFKNELEAELENIKKRRALIDQQGANQRRALIDQQSANELPIQKYNASFFDRNADLIYMVALLFQAITAGLIITHVVANEVFEAIVKPMFDKPKKEKLNPQSFEEKLKKPEKEEAIIK